MDSRTVAFSCAIEKGRFCINEMKSKNYIFLPFILVLFAFIMLQQISLTAIEKIIAKEHPVPAISHQRLDRLFVSDSLGRYVIFDVREQDEYERSHLQNALRVDPDLSSELFAKNYGKIVEQKHIVFYCSVGYRSSIFIERIDSLAKKCGALSLSNLTGGVFRWYNENLPVFDANGKTNEVHPYNDFWGKLLVKERKMAK